MRTHLIVFLLMGIWNGGGLLSTAAANSFGDPAKRRIPEFPGIGRGSAAACARLLGQDSPFAREVKEHLVEYRKALLAGDLPRVRTYLELGYPRIFRTEQSGAVSEYSALKIVLEGHQLLMQNAVALSTQAFHLAMSQRLEIVHLLLDQMTETERNWVDQRGENALHWCIRARFFSALEALVGAHIEIGRQNDENSYTFIDLILENPGANLPALLYLFEEPAFGLNTRAGLLSLEEGETQSAEHALCFFCQQKKDSLMTYVVRNLDLVVKAGMTRMTPKRPLLTLLLSEIKKRKMDLVVDRPDGFGNTALWHATRAMDPVAVRLLLDLGADPHRRGRGKNATSPYQEAARAVGSVRGLSEQLSSKKQELQSTEPVAALEKKMQIALEISELFGIRGEGRPAGGTRLLN